MKINISKNIEVEKLEDSTYLYIEKSGDFAASAPLAWKEFWEAFGPNQSKIKIAKMAGLSKIDDSKNDGSRFIYQAGVFILNEPENIKKPLLIRKIKSGNFAKFLLKGSYQQLGGAYPIAFAEVAKARKKIRNEFCMEIYLNDPSQTAEADLLTEILIPVEK